MKKFFTALVAVAAVASSCGPTDQFPDTITVNPPKNDPQPTDFTNTNTNTNTNITQTAKPLGAVSGVVLKTDLSPLVDADIEALVGSRAETFKGKTAADGSFRFAGVPAGAQVLVTVSKPGFATARMSSTVPSAAGTAPIDDGNASFGPILLSELNGSVRYLLTRADGRPAAGARATLRVSPVAIGVLSNFDQLTASLNHVTLEATANAQGQLLFGGVPSLAASSLMNGTFQLYVAPLDGDNDGFPETGGLVLSDSAQQLFQSGGVRFASLPGAGSTGAFIAESSNVASLRNAVDGDPLRNLVRTGETIQIVFTHPVQPQSFAVRVTNEYGMSLLPSTVAFSAGNYIANISLGASVSSEGEYNIDFRAVSANTGAALSRTGYFFLTGATASAVSIATVTYQEGAATGPASTQINPGEIMYVHFSVPLAQTAGQPLSAFIDADLGGPTAGVIGDVPGELGHPFGFPLFPNEPTGPVATTIPAETSVLPILTSGYTTRWAFTYAGPTALTSFGALRTVVAFSDVPGNNAIETYLGAPQRTDLTSTGVVAQPAPVP